MSSSGTAAVATKDEGTLSTEESELTGLVVPHNGHVFVDRVVADRWCVTHVLTHERRTLPPGRWALEVHEASGMAAAVDETEGSMQFLDLEDWLHRTLLQSEKSGEYFVKEKGQSAPKSWDAQRAWFREADVTLPIAAVGAKLALDCYVFKVARAGRQRVYWPLPQFYKVFQLTSYKKVPSRGLRMPWSVGVPS